jgi:hypothetical protein
MSLTNYQEHFDNTYQEVFQKTTVSKNVMNTRFESKLSYGESVERFAYDISGVRVRTVSRGNASTIDAVTDSTELLTINLEKEAVFHISDGEVKQAGPLNPGEVIGGKIARKVSIDLDARCFAEVLNASYDFDNGDLTTLSSSGTAITLSNTTVPQMSARMNAKLRYRNQIETDSNMIMVVDSYAASTIDQYLMSKEIDLAGFVFKNGYSGKVNNAALYITENLTGEAVLSLATNPTDGDTVTIGGVTYTFVDTIGTAAGNIHIESTVDLTRANLAAAINDPDATAAGYVALSSANQILVEDVMKLTATNDNAANTLTIVGIGSGRLIVAETLTDATDAWTKNFIHAYYGKQGAIDLVVQDLSPVDMRKTVDRRGTNVFSSYLAGIKTFADGAKQFLDLHIAA